MQTEPINKITNEQKDKALNFDCQKTMKLHSHHQLSTKAMHVFAMFGAECRNKKENITAHIQVYFMMPLA